MIISKTNSVEQNTQSALSRKKRQRKNKSSLKQFSIQKWLLAKYRSHAVTLGACRFFFAVIVVVLLLLQLCSCCCCCCSWRHSSLTLSSFSACASILFTFLTIWRAKLDETINRINTMRSWRWHWHIMIHQMVVCQTQPLSCLHKATTMKQATVDMIASNASIINYFL